jgi:hypothetical protein
LLIEKSAQAKPGKIVDWFSNFDYLMDSTNVIIRVSQLDSSRDYYISDYCSYSDGIYYTHDSIKIMAFPFMNLKDSFKYTYKLTRNSYCHIDVMKVSLISAKLIYYKVQGCAPFSINILGKTNENFSFENFVKDISAIKQLDIRASYKRKRIKKQVLRTFKSIN